MKTTKTKKYIMINITCHIIIRVIILYFAFYRRQYNLSKKKIHSLNSELKKILYNVDIVISTAIGTI